jgi:hypothetical protein
VSTRLLICFSTALLMLLTTCATVELTSPTRRTSVLMASQVDAISSLLWSSIGLVAKVFTRLLGQHTPVLGLAAQLPTQLAFFYVCNQIRETVCCDAAAPRLELTVHDRSLVLKLRFTRYKTLKYNLLFIVFVCYHFVPSVSYHSSFTSSSELKAAVQRFWHHR